eukprot:TRINITY_DN6843_c0_g2_i5.p1 TRINITY_DN6843_c0_g2~~TRINITY_DN6843_c0_g2_i5.p1  ORF type:complete len:115 (-),score=26.37 TRINITY_DN6843_c0_g2_i5:39-383(-)
MASERALLLYRCAFEEAIFKGTFSGNLETYDKVQSICNDKVIDYCIYNSMLEYFNTLIYSTEELSKDKDSLIKEEDVAGSTQMMWKDAMEIAKSKRKALKAQKKLNQSKKIKKT